MNYLAEGIQTGARIGAEAAGRRRDREHQEKLEALRRQLELDRQAKQIAAEEKLLNLKQLFETPERDARAGSLLASTNRTSRLTPAELAKLEADTRDKVAMTPEKVAATRANTAASIAGAKATMAGIDPEDPMNRAKRQNIEANTAWTNLRGPFEAAEIGLRDRALEFKQRDFEGEGGLSGLSRIKPVVISTQEEFDRLPKGARFIFNGRSGVKS